MKLSGGLSSLAANAFRNCPLLRKLTVPSTIWSVGQNAFSLMGSLREVTFGGLPPTGLASAGLPADITLRYSSEWAEDWADAIASCGFTNAVAYEGEAGGGDSGGGSGGSGGTLALTVTNVVVHYVTASLPSDAVIPPVTTGIVNVIAEVQAGKAIAVPSEWAAQYPGFAAAFGTDFTAALVSQTGKRDGAGNPMFVWQDFVAGTDPTNPDDVFTASLTFDKATGEPVVSWSPELSAAEAAKRIYRVSGKTRINDAEWADIDGNAGEFNFFRVTVEMR